MTPCMGFIMLELLSPAGSMDALRAAVQNGADSVYLGLGDFNARKNAKNFNTEDFHTAVQYCHVRGAKVYVTLNTLVTDREMQSAAEMITLCATAGVDALIIQDMGIISLARRIAPELPLHGSTQMSVHNLDGMRFCEELGLKRVVLARELSREQIAYICRSSPIEIEVFVHGALCMCYSGQCYMSSVIGRRSANRGLCAQPCRLPYGYGKVSDRYPLSLKDNCLIARLDELERIGVTSLKIEGRMKRPEYVAIATDIYSRAIKTGKRPTEDELRLLLAAFSRQGFTDGYYMNDKGPHMFGIRKDDMEYEKVFADARATYESGETQRVAVRYFAVIRQGGPAMLAVMDDEGNICKTEGPMPERAITRSLTEDEIKRQLAKSGGTPYYCASVRTMLDDGLSLPLSTVNAMRRDVLNRLTATREQLKPIRAREYTEDVKLVNSKDPPELTISVTYAEQITSELVDLSPRVLYIPIAQAVENPAKVSMVMTNSKITPCIILPRVIGDNEAAAVKKQLDKAYEMGFREALAGNIGHIDMARSRGFAVRGDFGLNMFNSLSLYAARHAGLISQTVSFELSLSQIRDLSKPIDLEMIAYGRLPLMVTENCIFKNQSGSCSCENTTELIDRTGVRFPVLRDGASCRSVIVNSQKLYLAEKYEQYSKLGLWAIRLAFTTETPAEIPGVVLSYVNQDKFSPAEYTRGLYFRGTI